MGNPMKRWTALLLLLIVLPTAALAGGQYIIPDSNTRRLTWDELWEWDYESLGYILNEIFARHGYNFEPGKKYYHYFMERPWYTPNADPNNSRACYSRLSSLEWANEKLVKDVRIEMRRRATKNPGGKSYLDFIEDSFDVLSGFALVTMKANQKFAVYSAPSERSYRGANGKASVSTNGAVYAAGWENGWLLVMYLTNNGSVRVGYISGVKDKLTLPYLNLDAIPVVLQENASLTDDPAMAGGSIAALRKGDRVVYLSEFRNRYTWAYVETIVGGQVVRGFIRADAIGMPDEVGEMEDSIGGNGS